MASLAISPWLTIPEFLAATGMSKRSFHYKQASYETRKEGKRLLIASSSLPADATSKLEALSTPHEIAVRPAAPSSAPAPLFAGVDLAEGSKRRIVLTAAHERDAMRRLSILQPLLDFSKDAATRARCQLLAVANKDGSTRPVRTVHDMAEYLAQTHASEEKGLSKQTILRWKGAYEKDGLSGLARKQRSDKGRRLWAERWPDAAKLVVAAYLTPHQSKQIAYDELVSYLRSLKVPAVQHPSYASVCDYLATIPMAAQIYGRLGERALHERTAPSLRRQYTDIEPNQIWVADTMYHDVLVRNDCFLGATEGAAVRLQLTALMDLRSRKMVGYTWCLDGSSRSITTSLIDAVKKYGPAAVFYCDNGRDFQKVGRYARRANHAAEVEQELQAIERTGAIRQLGMEITFCIPYHPQAKPIERFFGTLHKRFDALFPHYTTGNAYNKPDATVAAAELHRKVVSIGRAEESPLLPASHFIAMATTWIEQDYNAGHRHSGQGMKGRTPDEVFAPALATRRPHDASVLDALLFEKVRRKVRNCAVEVNGRRLVANDPFGSNQLLLASESEVVVCFDPNAPDAAIVCHADSGVKLCDVRAEVLVPYGAAGRPAVAASLQAQRGAKKTIKSSVQKLRREVATIGHSSALQDLHQHALQPAAVGPDALTQPVAKPRFTHGATAPKYAYEIAADVLEDE